jgi:hypothetical protein
MELARDARQPVLLYSRAPMRLNTLSVSVTSVTETVPKMNY